MVVVIIVESTERFAIAAAWGEKVARTISSNRMLRYGRPVEVAVFVLCVAAVPQKLELAFLLILFDRSLDTLTLQFHEVRSSFDLNHHVLVLISLLSDNPLPAPQCRYILMELLANVSNYCDILGKPTLATFSVTRIVHDQVIVMRSTSDEVIYRWMPDLW